jgi:hypothetical protein
MITWFVHGVITDDVNKVRDYIYKGDAHDRSKVQFVWEENDHKYDVFNDPNDTETFLTHVPYRAEQEIIHALAYHF